MQEYSLFRPGPACFVNELNYELFKDKAEVSPFRILRPFLGEMLGIKVNLLWQKGGNFGTSVHRQVGPNSNDVKRDEIEVNLIPVKFYPTIYNHEQFVGKDYVLEIKQVFNVNGPVKGQEAVQPLNSNQLVHLGNQIVTQLFVPSKTNCEKVRFRDGDTDGDSNLPKLEDHFINGVKFTHEDLRVMVESALKGEYSFNLRDFIALEDIVAKNRNKFAKEREKEQPPVTSSL